MTRLFTIFFLFISAVVHAEDSVLFKETPTNIVHTWDESTHPFVGGAVIDIDNDGVMEIFVGGGKNQQDALLRYVDGSVRNVIFDTGLSNKNATYGALSIDIDNNDRTDLIVARANGIYVYRNMPDGFEGKLLSLNLPSDSVPLAITATDINQDGYADLYVSVFVDTANFRSAVFNDPEHAKTNLMLLNDGKGNFIDITQKSGTAGEQNTFLSVFSDLDNDGWQDLIVAQNTGELEIFANKRNETFERVAVDSGYGFWMGLALGDIDNDGDQDVFITNAGDSIPGFLTTGDLRDDQRHNLEWLLLENKGQMRFENVAKELALEDQTFAWGAVIEDLNLDGKLDMLVAENYIKWPVHKVFKLKGKVYMRTDQGFIEEETWNLENPYFGQSPLIVDLNNDQKPDVIWLNMDGPVRAFLNQSTNNSFLVRVPEQANLLGTRVSVQTASGNSYTREVMTGIGLHTDQTPNLFFGLGGKESVTAVQVVFPDGRERIIQVDTDQSSITLKR